MNVSSKENAWEACVLLDSWAVLVQLDGGMSTIVNHMVSSAIRLALLLMAHRSNNDLRDHVYAL